MKILKIFALFLISLSCFAIENVDSYFISLRSNEINLRNGPGSEYPIKAIYQINNMPLKVLGEY